MDSQGEQEISQIIEQSLESILSGETTLDAVLRQYPELADILRGELESALWLVSRQRAVAPRPGYIVASRKRLVARIQEDAKGSNARRASLGLVFPRKLSFTFASLLVVFLLLLLGSTGVVSASRSAVPGDHLYSVKRAAENVTYSLTFDTEKRAELQLEYSKQRLNEVETLISRGRYDKVAIALHDYQAEVKQAVNLLQNVHPQTASLEEQQQLAATVQGQLLAQSQQLENLLTVAPTETHNEIRGALVTSNQGISTAQDVIKKLPTPNGSVTPSTFPTPTLMTTVKNPIESVVPGVLSTVTQQPPGVILPGDTPIPESTVKPSETSLPLTSPTATTTGTETNTATTTPIGTPGVSTDLNPSATPIPTSEKKPTHTPKPTNENRPTKPVQPTDPPKAVEPTVQPTDPPKPTNDNRPTKQVKSTDPPLAVDPTQPPKDNGNNPPPKQDPPPGNPTVEVPPKKDPNS